jgi:hypothetical protein
MISKLNKLTDVQFVGLVSKCNSIAEVVSKLGYAVTGSGHTKVRDRIQLLGLYDSLIKRTNLLRGRCLRLANRISDKEFLVKGVRRHNSCLRKRLILLGIPYCCSGCGLEAKWNGKVLSLQIDHIDGDRDNNTKENLRFMCPNCHSQTPTFSGKNNKRPH